MKKMKNLLILAIVIALPMMYINAADATADKSAAPAAEKKVEAAKPAGIVFPGKFNIEYTCYFQNSMIDGQPKIYSDGNSYSYYNGNNQGDAAYMLRNQLTAGITFPIASMYSNKLWLTNQTDVRFDSPNVSFAEANNNAALGNATGVNSGATWSQAGAAYSTAFGERVRVRDRLSFGFDNTITIPNALTIGVNVDLMIDNTSWGWTGIRNVKDDRTSASQTNLAQANAYCLAYTMLRFTPTVVLSGNYSFGLSWQVKAPFYFWFAPQYAAEAGTSPLFKTEIDPYINLGFDFMHFAGVKDVAGKIFVDLDMDMNIYGSDYVFGGNPNSAYGAAWNTGATLTSGQPVSDVLGIWCAADFKFVNYFGFDFNIWGIKPLVAFKLQNAWAYDADPSTALWTTVGIKAGIGFTKDIFTFSFAYTGQKAITRNGLSTSTDYSSMTATDRTYVITKIVPWENLFETAITIKM